MKIWLVTHEFPRIGKENVFVANEFKELCKHFEVNIITCGTGEIEYEDAYTDGRIIKEYHLPRDISHSFTIFDVLRCFFSNVFLNELVSIIRGGHKIIQRVIDSLYFLLCSYRFERWLISEGNEIGCGDIIFTFWCTELTMGALLLKRKKQIKVVTRMHGIDLYEERNRFGRQPYRNQMDSKLDGTIFTSKKAMDYYIGKGTIKSSDRIVLSRLCAVYPTESSSNKTEDIIRIVSCSELIKLKRVDKIIEALSNMSASKIEWVHFGDGPEMNSIKCMASEKLGPKSNITYYLMGDVPNERIHSFYSSSYVDCFITLSATEGGCPFSVQEAMAYGIPIIATNVGDLCFMVDGNGWLIDDDPLYIEDVVDALRSLCSMSSDERMCYSKKSLFLFERLFSCERNAGELIEFLSDLGK